MYLFQILLPPADNSGRPFPKQEFDRLKEELAQQFAGVTAFLQAPAEGLWRQGDQCSNDEIVIFEVMAEDNDLPAWRIRRADLERRFPQDEVIIRYSSIGVV
ncbi:hypothetical protein [Mesorhizobium sp. M1329]|uniref:hypothetical protein n=1 Tax=Mesorhizobium sp. M1329 TaxID=2957083 RepID=UPI00333CB635